jgi:dihydroorotase
LEVVGYVEGENFKMLLKLSECCIQNLFMRNILLFSFVIALVFSRAHAQEIDILLKGGHVIDPKNKIDEVMDVAIVGEKIYRVAPDIPSTASKRTINVSGLIVTPGIIDIHTHVFHGTSEARFSGFEINNGFGSVVPDDFTFRAGVTTVVDAGSSGWRDFHTFKKQTVDNSQTRVLAFISITGKGMSGTVHAQDLSDMNPATTAFIMNEYKDIIVGIKAHHYQGHDFTPVDRAVEAGNLTGKPVIVDFGSSKPALSLEELLMEHLRPGDIFTHTYAYSVPGRESVIDEDNLLKPYILRAQKSGRVFDVGHGGGAFRWHVANASVEQGFLPNTISTDLYRASRNAGMKDMANVMSKFLALGLSVQDIILRSTWNPASVILRPDLGHLTEGAEADIAVFNVREGKFGFMDARGLTMNGTKKFEAELTLRAGRIVWDLNGISGPQWDSIK